MSPELILARVTLTSAECSGNGLQTQRKSIRRIPPAPPADTRGKQKKKKEREHRETRKRRRKRRKAEQDEPDEGDDDDCGVLIITAQTLQSAARSINRQRSKFQGEEKNIPRPGGFPAGTAHISHNITLLSDIASIFHHFITILL